MSNKFRIHIIASTRPDFIRLARFIKLCKAHPDIECTFIATGQHYDATLYEQFFSELNIPRPDKVLELKQETVVKQIAALLRQLDDFLISLQDEPDVVVFLGDVNGVLGSIAYLKYNIPIVHIESGQRSFRWEMPEESNRSIIDKITNRHYVYHEDAKINLVREGINPSNIIVVGNIICDALEDYAAEIKEREYLIYEKFGIPPRFFLMTMHRAENLKDPIHALRILIDINHLAEKYNTKVLLPVMPRLKELIKDNISLLGNFIFKEPLGFLDFVALEKRCDLLITDSGTCQEEGALFGKRTIVIRDCTERPFCLSSINVMALDRFDKIFEEMPYGKTEKISLGDGKTSERILDDMIKNHYKLSVAHTKIIDTWVSSRQI